jgi:hypothetical protein
VEHNLNNILNGLSRRKFLAGAGGTAAAMLAAGCSDGIATLPSVNAYSDTDILNFALNLEYIEAEFYLRAATGSGLSSADAGSGAGAVNGGTKISGLSTFQQNFLNEIAYTEQEHVRFLRSQLGSAAVSRPAIDLTGGFMGVVTNANSLSTSSSLPAIPTSFSPFANFDSFLVGALAFEDVGVTAYAGAAPLISSAGIAAGILAASEGILAVEAYHAGTLRTTLTGNAITQGTTAYPYPLYANRVGNLLNALSGATTEIPLMGFQSGPSTVANVGISSVVAADSNAIGFHRNTDQVLHIVYGKFTNSGSATTPAAGVSGGGFFPNGLNGNIKVTQS